MSAQLSGLGVAIAAVGGLLVYTGVRDVAMVDAVRQLAGGVTPTGAGPRTTTVSFVDAGAVSGQVMPAPGAGGTHPEIATAAARYIGTPYRWGGKAPGGLDCSGLVYRAILDATGVKAPLGSSAQAVWRGFAPIGRAEVGAGDVVWWPGHIAVADSPTICISAPRPGLRVRRESIDSAGPAGTGAPTRCLRFRGTSSTASSTRAPAGSVRA